MKPVFVDFIHPQGHTLSVNVMAIAYILGTKRSPNTTIIHFGKEDLTSVQGTPEQVKEKISKALSSS